jgi:hypothetical protein
MSEAALREQLYDSFKNRAVIYYLIYDELRTSLGADRAEEILSRAVYRRGAMRGKETLAQFGPNDMTGLKAAFLGGIPDDGRMFQPEILHDDPAALDIQFHGCPLRDAWLELGLQANEVETMCRIAGRIDNGLFEAAGFRFSSETWKPGDSGCCRLHIRPGE